jgi:hypothetical protein
MKKLISTTSVLAAITLVSGPAFAEECSGVNARMYEAPVVIHKAEDGATTSFLNSTGSSTLLTPADAANTGWQHCSGIMVARPDKSISASGICYRVATDGNWETVSWTWEGNDRKWKRENGTGEMRGAASGTFEPSVYLAGNLGIGSWKGDCE